MQASRFEYRFRIIIHALIYLLGFTAPWLFIPALADVPGFAQKSTWLIAASTLSRQGWLTFSAATIVLLALALLLTALGAFFRIWGAAYVGASIVQSPTMHGDRMLADGPYRRTRNPLYLGTLLHTIGIAILMPPSGAVFTIALLWIFEVRLALAEEPFLTARFGQPYLDYKAAVPRFQPPRIPAGSRPSSASSISPRPFSSSPSSAGASTPNPSARACSSPSASGSSHSHFFRAPHRTHPSPHNQIQTQKGPEPQRITRQNSSPFHWTPEGPDYLIRTTSLAERSCPSRPWPRGTLQQSLP